MPDERGDDVARAGGERTSSRLLAVAALVMLCLFGLATAAGIDVGEHFDADRSHGWIAAAGIALLTLDAYLPIPSTAVMATLGAALGTGLGGAAAFTGLIAGSAVAFLTGRAALNVGPVRRAGRETTRPSFMVVAATRGIPILSEATAFTCGATLMAPLTFVAAVATGAAPVAAAGAAGGDLLGFEATMVATGGLIAVAVIVWTLRSLRAATVGEAAGP